MFGCFTDVQRKIRTPRWKMIYYPKRKIGRVSDSFVIFLGK